MIFTTKLNILSVEKPDNT